MRKRLLPAALALVAVHAAAAPIALSALVPAFQSQPMKPTAPGTPGDPKWQGQVRLSDGRTFVTDGGLAIDAALARPDPLPARVLAAKVLEGYLAAKPKDEFSVSDLRKGANGRTYTAPSGVVLNATYIDYLRRILPVASLRLRVEGDLKPVVVVSKGVAVGVLMPVAR
jgi:hypothetical protein